MTRRHKKDYRISDIHGEPYVCHYCGQHADSVDHVIPQSTLRTLAALSDLEITKKMLRNRALKVWACRQESLEDRKTYLKLKLIKRYRRILELPTWDENEIDELGYNLQVYVRSSIKFKEYISQRIAW